MVKQATRTKQKKRIEAAKDTRHTKKKERNQRCTHAQRVAQSANKTHAPEGWQGGRQAQAHIEAFDQMIALSDCPALC